MVPRNRIHTYRGTPVAFQIAAGSQSEEGAQKKVSIRVDGATELNVCGGQSASNFSSGITRMFAAAASDWLILVPNSVASSTRIETFGLVVIRKFLPYLLAPGTCINAVCVLFL